MLVVRIKKKGYVDGTTPIFFKKSSKEDEQFLRDMNKIHRLAVPDMSMGETADLLNRSLGGKPGHKIDNTVKNEVKPKVKKKTVKIRSK